jgi:hypothetical protein
MEGEIFSMNELGEIVFSEVKERAEDLEGGASESEVGHGTHGGESACTGSAEESEEQGFGLVVCVVGEGDVAGVTFAGGFTEETQPFAAAGGFEGFVVAACALGDVEGARDERDVPR